MVGNKERTVVMTQTKTPSFIQQLREKHQALARAAAVTGVTPEGFADDPAFLDLVANFSKKTVDESCVGK